MSWFANYRVRVVQHDIDDSWAKEFGADSHAALDFYRKCGNAQETLGIRSTVTAERSVEDGEWVVVFRREVSGLF